MTPPPSETGSPVGIGKVLGDFRLLREIGRGGMGIVYEAEQVSLSRRVALKTLPAQLTLNPQALDRFRREASLTARLQHPNIVEIFAVGEDRGVHFIAMELIDGIGLDEIIHLMRRGELADLQSGHVTEFLRQRDEKLGRTRTGLSLETEATPTVLTEAGDPEREDTLFSEHDLEEDSSGATALFSFHDVAESQPGETLEDQIVSLQGLHGSSTSAGADYIEEFEQVPGKPQSTSTKGFVETATRLFIQVAEALHHAHGAGIIHRDVKPSNIMLRRDGTPVLMDFGLARQEDVNGLTVSGEFLGTPNYASPEQAAARMRELDGRTDVFALGATLYELLTLQRAFEGRTPHEVLTKIISKEPEAPQRLNPSLAPDLVTIVLKSLEKAPASRYLTAQRMAQDLRAFLDYRPIDAKRTPPFARAMRWVRREPLMATLLCLGVLAIPVAGFIAWQQVKLVHAEKFVVANRIQNNLNEGFTLLASDPARATESFRAVLEDHRKSEEGLVGLVLALRRNGESAEALELLADHPAASDGSSVLTRLHAEVLQDYERYDEADALLDRLEAPRSATSFYLAGMRILQDYPTNRLVEYRDVAGRGEIRALDRSDNEAAKLAVRRISSAISWSQTLQPRVRHAMAWALWAAGDDPERALEEAHVLQTFWPDSKHSLYWSALALEIADEDEALAAYDRVLELDPDYAIAHLSKAMFQIGLGDLEGAAFAMERYAELRPDAQAYTNLAALQWELGDLEGSLASCDRAAQFDADYPATWDTRGNCLMELGRVTEAREAWERAVELAPDNAHYRNDLAVALMELGDLEVARSHLEHGLRQDADDADLQYNMGELHRRTGDRAGSIAYFERATELRPDWSDAWTYLLDAYAAGQEWGRAINAGWSSVDSEAADAQHYMQLGRVLVLAGQFTEAVVPLETARELDPKSRDAHGLLNRALAMTGAPAPVSLDVLRAWADELPEDHEAWNELAWMQVDPKGDPAVRSPERALAAAERAVTLTNRELPAYLDTLAVAQWASGLRDEAIATAERALDLALAAEPTDEGLVVAIRGTLDAFLNAE